MNLCDDAEYHLRLAEGFLQEAGRDIQLSRQRSYVDNAKLAVENAGKTIIAALGPVGGTHEPSHQLQRLLEEKALIDELVEEVKRVLPLFGNWVRRNTS